MESIYLNAAGRGLPDRAVIDRMAAHLRLEAEIGERAAEAKAADELAQTRHLAAQLLGGAQERIGFATNTSAPWLSLVAAMPLQGRRVLVAPHEWWTNIRALSRLGAKVEILPSLDPDSLNLDTWAARMEEDVAGIFVPMVSSIAGIRYPMSDIGALDRPKDALFVVDAAQAIGQGAFSVEAMGCDALMATTRKWVRGPRQTSLFWMGERASAVTGLALGDVEPFDVNVAARLGLGIALAHLSDNGHANPLSDYTRDKARALGLSVVASDAMQTNAVAIRIPHAFAARMQAAIEKAGILVKWPDPGRDEPGSAEAQDGQPLMRVSPHRYNTPEQLDRLFAVIDDILSA